MPLPAQAHPHIYIDTTIEVIFNAAGQAEALRIGWAYDDFFSLTYLAENGYDPDFDGKLTAEEEAKLSGFDMEWDATFAGDTYALQNGQAIALSRPAAFTATLVGDKLTSTHLRTLAPPVRPTADAPLIVQVYDPSYYTAYTIAAVPVLTGGTACGVQVYEPDVEAADARLQAALDELAGSPDVEIDFPAIGDAYAEEARITCPTP